jgi:hypothetical protein
MRFGFSNRCCAAISAIVVFVATVLLPVCSLADAALYVSPNFVAVHGGSLLRIDDYVLSSQFQSIGIDGRRFAQSLTLQKCAHQRYFGNRPGNMTETAGV